MCKHCNPVRPPFPDQLCGHLRRLGNGGDDGLLGPALVQQVDDLEAGVRAGVLVPGGGAHLGVVQPSRLQVQGDLRGGGGRMIEFRILFNKTLKICRKIDSKL